MFIDDDLTVDKNFWMNSEVYRAILAAQIQPNTAKLKGHCSNLEMDDEPFTY